MKIPTGITSFFSAFWLKMSFILVVIAALILLGGKVGYDMRDRTALQQQQKIEQQAVTDVNNYKKQIADLLTKQHDLSSQLEQALQVSQNVVTKTITQTIVKEVHDHPNDYQCTIPASGMHIVADQAQQLNSLRSGSSKNH